MHCKVMKERKGRAGKDSKNGGRRQGDSEGKEVTGKERKGKMDLQS